MEDLARGMRREDGLHQEIIELLPWYLNETLSSEEAQRVAEHLKSCKACERELQEVQGLQKIIAAPAEAFSSEAALQSTMREIRSRQQKTAPAQKEKHPSWWQSLDWGAVLRPRMALGVAVMATLFIAVGWLIGQQFQADKEVDYRPVGDALTDQPQVLPFNIRLQGKFKMEMGKQTLSEESFTLLFNNKSKDLLLTSEIQASEIARAGKATQGLQLTGQYRPVGYTISGPLVYEGTEAKARFTERQVIMDTRDQSQGKEQKAPVRIVDLKDFPVVIDFNVMSHYAILHRILVERLQTGDQPDQLQFTAVTPQALKDNPLIVKNIESAQLAYQGKTIETKRYEIEMGTGASLLRFYLYEEATDKERILIAIHMPAQPSLPALSDILAYRSDLYPLGLELNQGAQ
jgi:hypothetical protein